MGSEDSTHFHTKRRRNANASGALPRGRPTWSHLRVRRGSPADVLILLALLAGAVALRAWHRVYQPAALRNE
jgi:hypothetical protein